MELFLLALVGFINLTMIAVIFLSGKKNTINISFLLLLMLIVGWAIGDMLMLFSDNKRLAMLGLQMFMVIPMYVSLAIVYFAHFFPKKTSFSKSDIPWIFIPLAATTTLALYILAKLDLFVTFIANDQPFNDYSVNSGYNDIYSPYFTVYFLLYAGIFVYRFLHSKGIDRKRIQYLMISLVVATIIAVTFNIMTPIKTGTLDTAWVGPLSSTLLIAATIFSILKYQLFDVKYTVFRLLAYFLSLSIISLLFISVAFNLTTLFFSQSLIPLSIQIYYMLTAIILALSFRFLKDFVDKGTNRLFFQQGYSVHNALNKISDFSTRSVDANKIQRHTLNVIDETIRPEYAAFIVHNVEGDLQISTHTHTSPIQALQLKDFLAQLSKIRQKIALTEEITDDRGHMKQYTELAHIGLIVHLFTNNKSIGYLVLGHKKNGNSYNQHDQQLLTLASNDLALALQNALAFQEIQEFNATLQTKVSSATAALKRTNQKLVALDDTKDEFISMASHQLRTPLTSIKGYISMMLEGDLGKINDTQRKALEEAFNSSQRMVFLISDFLNISRIRTGKFVMEKGDTDLNKIVLEEIAQLRDLAGLRDQTINYTPPKNFPVVQLDETKTRQVMMNFIDNSIFYTPKNGKIDIVLQQTDKEIIFSVTDTGIGVPKNVQHRLFTKFFRAENARNARPDGTGLGLFMGQKIIDSQGGKVIFNSIEHQGSTFGFRFPLKVISKIDQKDT